MSRRRIAAAVVAGLFALYCLVAGLTFSLRHPWATQTEKMLHIGTVLTFGTINYDDHRPPK